MTSPFPDATAVVRHRLEPPRPPRVHLPRPALVGRVLDVEPGGVCVVAAPAGYGCTVLLAEAAAASPTPVAWVSVPGEDRTSVWRHVLAALGAAGVDVTGPAAHLGDAEPHRFRAALLNALDAAPTPLLLVVDDLDGLAHGDVVEDLAVVADALPPTLRLVLRLEHDSLTLRRGVTTGRVVRLDVQDLSLREPEATALVRMLAPDLPDDRAEALVGLADGWVAALTSPFAPGARDRDQDPAEWLVDSGIGRLGAALLDPLPPDDRELLVGVSVVPWVTAALAAELAGCGGEAAARTLDRLQGWGLLRPAPAPAGALVLHRLARDHARRLAALRGPAAVTSLHRSAAQWLAAAGETTAAIDQALDAGDLAWALRMMEGAVEPLIHTGQAEQVHRFYERTPESAVSEHDVHLLAASWAELMSGNVSSARRRIDQLIDKVDRLGSAGMDGSAASSGEGEASGAEWLRGEVLLLRSYYAWWRGRPEHSRHLAAQAGGIFGADWTRMAHQACAVQVVRAGVWFSDTQQAHALLLQLTSRPGLREPLRRVVVPGLQAVLAVRQGRVRRALTVAEGAVWAARTFGSPAPFSNADARLALSLAQIDLGEAAAGLSQTAGLADQAAEYGHTTYLFLARVVQARALARLGRTAEATRLLAAARHDLSAAGGDAQVLQVADRAEAQARLESGDRAGAAQLLRRLEPGADTELLALRLASRGSDEVLRRTLGMRPRDVRQAVQVQLLMATAYARVRPAEGQSLLLRAAAAAEAAGLLTALCGFPDELHVLAARVAEQPGGDAVAVLLRHARLPGPVDPEPPAPVPRLSAGERELLALMQTHSGHRALAEALGVSVNTVKTRLRRLYGKLGVSDQQSAVAVARAGGVLAALDQSAPSARPRASPGRE